GEQEHQAYPASHVGDSIRSQLVDQERRGWPRSQLVGTRTMAPVVGVQPPARGVLPVLWIRNRRGGDLAGGGQRQHHLEDVVGINRFGENASRDWPGASRREVRDRASAVTSEPVELCAELWMAVYPAGYGHRATAMSKHITAGTVASPAGTATGRTDPGISRTPQ